MASYGAWTPSSQWGLNQWNPTASAYQFGNMPTGTSIDQTPDAGSGLGLNADTFRLGLGGLNTLGNLWGALQSNRLARDQLAFTRNITNTNLNNSIQSYNTSLEDRARARAAMEGQSDTDAQAYIDRNRLSR